MEKKKAEKQLSKIQYMKWLLTCGMVSYRNAADQEESQAFKEEDEMDILEITSDKDIAGMLEFSQSTSGTNIVHTATTALDEADALFSLDTEKNEQRHKG